MKMAKYDELAQSGLPKQFVTYCLDTPYNLIKVRLYCPLTLLTFARPCWPAKCSHVPVFTQ